MTRKKAAAKSMASAAQSNAATTNTPAAIESKASGSKAANAGKANTEGSGAEDGGGGAVQVKNLQLLQDAKDLLELAISQSRTASNEEIEREVEISKWRLGFALLRFAGPGDVFGMVNLERDPNERFNPRDLDMDHVKRLTKIFLGGGKRDRASPIRIALEQNLLSAELRAKMSKANPLDPTSEIPPLKLVRPHGKEEDVLEYDLWTRYADGQHLTEQELEVRRARLAELRGGRPKGKLINGFHRIQAMVESAKPLIAAQMQVGLLAQSDSEGGPELLERMKAIVEAVAQATYAVEVFRDDTPDYVIAWLSENEEERPNYAPRPGEKLWSLVEGQETMAKKMVDEGDAEDRVEALNFMNAVRERSAVARELTKSEASVYAALDIQPEKKKKGKGKTTKVHGVLTEDACRSLMAYPTTMEMVVDTHAALWVYNNRMNDTHVVQMRREGGASFVAHYWLGTNILILITNVAHGLGLEEAEEYLKTTPEGQGTSERDEAAGERSRVRLSSEGDSEAVKHWNNLHANPQRVPGLLNRYEDNMPNIFDKILKEELGNDDIDFRAIDYGSPRHIEAIRNTFERFSDSYSSMDMYSRKLRASIRLYARLPLWKKGSSEPAFYPAALLPGRWMSALSSVVGGGDPYGAWVVELLLDRFQLLWTAGSVGSSVSKNLANWYGHAQLSLAIELLDNPRWNLAYRTIDNFDMLCSELKFNCGASKSTLTKPHLLVEIAARKQHHRSSHDVETAYDLARRALKKAVFSSEEDKLEELVGQHDILQVVLPIAFWRTFPFGRWARGWEDSPDKRRNTVFGGLGWAMLGEEMCVRVVAPSMRDYPDARYLLHVVREIADPQADPPWWSILGWSTELRNLQPAPANDATAATHANAIDDTDEPQKRAPTRRSGRSSTQLATSESNARSSSKSKSKVTPAPSTHASTPAKAAPHPKSKAQEPKSKEIISSSAEEEDAGGDGDDVDDVDLVRTDQSAPSDVDQLESESENYTRATAPVTKQPDRAVEPPQQAHNVQKAPDGSAARTSAGAKAKGKDRSLSPEPSLAEREVAARLEIERRSAMATVRGNVLFGEQLFAKWSDRGEEFEVTPFTKSGVNEVELLTKASPGHISFLPLFNTSIPSTRYHSDLFHVDDYDGDLLDEEANCDPARVSKLFDLIHRERQQLRENVVSYGRSLLTSTYGTDLAMSGMARTMVNFKDIFVSRVICHIERFFDEEYRPVADAMWMAQCDGLYEAELLTVEMASGKVWAHLKSTFPKALQDEMGRTSFLLGTLQTSNEERKSIVQTMRHFLPLHAYGRTEAESSQMAVHAVRFQANTQIARQGKDRAAGHTSYEPIDTFTDRLPAFGSTGQELRKYMGAINDSPQGFEYFFTRRMGRMTSSATMSPLSNGVFTHPYPTNLTPESQTVRQMLDESFTRTWRKIQDETATDFHDFVDKHLQPPQVEGIMRPVARTGPELGEASQEPVASASDEEDEGGSPERLTQTLQQAPKAPGSPDAGRAQTTEDSVMWEPSQTPPGPKSRPQQTLTVDVSPSLGGTQPLRVSLPDAFHLPASPAMPEPDSPKAADIHTTDEEAEMPKGKTKGKTRDTSEDERELIPSRNPSNVREFLDPAGFKTPKKRNHEQMGANDEGPAEGSTSSRSRVERTPDAKAAKKRRPIKGGKAGRGGKN